MKNVRVFKSILSIVFSIYIAAPIYAATLADFVEGNLAGIACIKDDFKNFHFKAAQVRDPSNLPSIVAEAKEKHPNISVYFHQPLADGKWFDTLKALGFTIETALDGTGDAVWLFRNGRAIPAFSPVSTCNMVFVYCTTTKRFMFVKEKMWGWTVPGGSADLGEHPHVGAAREGQEESKITLDPAKLKLIGTGSYTRENKMFGPTSSIIQVFIGFVDEEYGEPDGHETTDLKWLPIDAIESGKEYEGTKFHLFLQRFMRTMHNEASIGTYVPVEDDSRWQICITNSFKKLGIS